MDGLLRCSQFHLSFVPNVYVKKPKYQDLHPGKRFRSLCPRVRTRFPGQSASKKESSCTRHPNETTVVVAAATVICQRSHECYPSACWNGQYFDLYSLAIALCYVSTLQFYRTLLESGNIRGAGRESRTRIPECCIIISSASARTRELIQCNF
jgi:hypothetical protein